MPAAGSLLIERLKAATETLELIAAIGVRWRFSQKTNNAVSATRSRKVRNPTCAHGAR